MTKKTNTKKEVAVKVEVKRAKKLTQQEINALVETTIANINTAIRNHNASFFNTLEYKTEVKAIKTKYGVLKAERCLIAFAARHPKVEFFIKSTEYDAEIKKLDMSYRKSTLNDYSTSADFRNIKNKLILHQADGHQSTFDMAYLIAQEYLSK